jgi:[ribosomal protein S18]-alanine N-acetyltransferase
MTARSHPVTLRPMTVADLPVVTALEHDLFPDDAWPWEMFASELGRGQPAAGRDADRYYLVADQAGEIVGYAGLVALPFAGGDRAGDDRDGDDRAGDNRAGGDRRGRPAAGGPADVLTMAVAEAHWGQGIGTALLTALLTEAAERGCDEVFLEVRADNPRAQRLYRRHGFAAIGVRRGYYQPSGTDAIVMHRSIGQGATGLPAASQEGTRS